MKTVILVRASDMSSEYNKKLLEILLLQESLNIGDQINIPTNISFRGSDKIVVIFNNYLRLLNRQGVVKIVINKNK